MTFLNLAARSSSDCPKFDRATAEVFFADARMAPIDLEAPAPYRVPSASDTAGRTVPAGRPLDDAALRDWLASSMPGAAPAEIDDWAGHVGEEIRVRLDPPSRARRPWPFTLPGGAASRSGGAASRSGGAASRSSSGSGSTSFPSSPWGVSTLAAAVVARSLVWVAGLGVLVRPKTGAPAHPPLYSAPWLGRTRCRSR